MSDDKKQKGNWCSLLLGVVLGSVITVGAFQISVNRAKNLDWGWTGFGKSTTKEITRSKKDQTGPFTETRKYQSGKTLWDWLELLAIPIQDSFYKAVERDYSLSGEQVKQILQRICLPSGDSFEAYGFCLIKQGWSGKQRLWQVKKIKVEK